ncbi:hypothetical protein [Paenibacillus sinopodophylli]|uniref:hypothetical protein n=1 Tax=Paenibacillus sinopodophylli TaxID=1837342 RepID=UPI00110CA4FC|nr:hypothetical protein [Paenibacillus sinopodophylli]
MTRKSGFIIMAVLALMTIGLALDAVRVNTDNFGYFLPLKVTLHNESDFDVVSIETGIQSGSEKQVITKTVKPGAKAIIKPNFHVKGEGAVYLKYTDSRGNITETSACGYTESMSGRTSITIDNDGVLENEQKCY